MTKSHNTTFAALAAVAGLMLIAAVTLPTTAYAVKGENPKTESGPRTNPQGDEIPGTESETTTCTTQGGSTPPGHEPVDGECKGNDECTVVTTVSPGNSGKQKTSGTEEC